MSYDVSLLEKESGNPCEVEAHYEGAIIQVGGKQEADFNVTYNYGRWFRETLEDEGLYALDEMTGAESIPLLEKAVALLGTEQDENYWSPTPGNAGYALNVMLGWAREHPDGIWMVR